MQDEVSWFITYPTRRLRRFLTDYGSHPEAEARGRVATLAQTFGIKELSLAELPRRRRSSGRHVRQAADTRAHPGTKRARRTTLPPAPNHPAFVDGRQLPEEAQRSALAQLVSAIADLDTSSRWGEGRTAASDGQRFSLPRRVLQQTYKHPIQRLRLGVLHLRGR